MRFLRPLTVLAALTLAGAAAAQDYTATALGGGLTLISGPDGNSVLGRAGADVVLIDGGRTENARALLDFVLEQTGGAAPTTLIATDWHPERTGLNEILGAQGVRIVMHQNARQWLEFGDEDLAEGISYPPRPETAWADMDVPDDGMALSFGDGELRIGFLQQAHCDSDLYVHFPGAGVLVTGPAVRTDGWVMIDWWAGGYVGGQDDAMHTLLEVAGDAAVIVPSSGPVLDRAGLEEYGAMVRTTFDRVSDLVLGAKSPQESADAKPVADIHPEWADADEFVMRAHRSFRTHLRRDPRLGPIP